MPENFRSVAISTTWGEIQLGSRAGSVVDCTLPGVKDAAMPPFEILSCGRDVFSAYVRAVLTGRNPTRPPIGTLEGSVFQLKVWQGILSIPRGETRSYAQLAEHIGQPDSCRAVANACGRNPVPLFIPCHRVVGSNGYFGGFSSGLAWKRLLLKLEQ